jgi:hypothetical protein
MKPKKIHIVTLVTLSFLLGVLYLSVDNPNPRIRKWIARTDRLVILYDHYGISVSEDTDCQTIEINDKDEINDWLKNIETVIRVQSPFVHEECACRGNPWLRLYEKDDLVAEITIHTNSIKSRQLSIGNINIRKRNLTALWEKCADLGIEWYLWKFPDRMDDFDKEKSPNSAITSQEI